MRLTAALILFAAAPAFAQGLPDWAEPLDVPRAVETTPSPPDAMPPPPPPPIPVDGGLVLLALSGVGLAARKLRASR